MRKRWQRFRRLKRGYYSFLIIAGLYVVSLFSGLFISNKAILVGYNGELYFPAFKFFRGEFFGQTHAYGERNLGVAN